LVVAHNPELAAETRTLRQEKIQTLETQAAAWVGKLDQDAGVKAHGKRLSDSGAEARLYHAVKDARLAKILRADLKNELFSYDIDHDALALAELMDGKLLLVTNTGDKTPEGVAKRYKSLADIERGFRVQKSEIEIGPVFHRLLERIKTHASICFIALFLYRVIRQRLSTADSDLSPERALDHLQRLNSYKSVSSPHHRDLPTFRNPQSRLCRAESKKKARSTTATSSLVVHVFKPWFITFHHLHV